MIKMKFQVLALFCLLCCNGVRLDSRHPRPFAARWQNVTHVQNKQSENPCKSRPMDFVLVIDSSRSIRPDDYEKVKTFIHNLLQFLEIGPEATRVGLLQYGSVVQNEFSLNKYSNKTKVEQAVKNMQHLATGTMTGLAIQYTVETAFTEAEGARQARLGVPRIAMIVTDGRPQDSVEEVAAQARRAGIQIFVVGVGRVDMSTLKAMGSEPHTEHVYLVANFSQMETLLSVFQSKLCGGIAVCDTVDHQCQHECVSSPTSYRCTCRNGFTLNPDGRTCKDVDPCQTVDHRCEHQCISSTDSYICKCMEGFMLAEDGRSCKKPECGEGVMDLVFVIDGSKSLGHDNFELVKQFVNGIVDALDISQTGTRVGLVQYSTKVRTEFTLGQYSAARDIKEAVSGMRYMGRGSMTGSALRHMYELSFSAREGARPNVPHVGIVFTDGRSQNDVSEWANKAKNSGVTIYALGVGKAVEQELREMATRPSEKYVYYTEDFEKLEEVTKKLKSRICNAPFLLDATSDITAMPQVKPAEENTCQCEDLIMFQKQVTDKLRSLERNIEGMTTRLKLLEDQLVKK
ncbi:matrilin-1-like [Festucalex cinctus]